MRMPVAFRVSQVMVISASDAHWIECGCTSVPSSGEIAIETLLSSGSENSAWPMRKMHCSGRARALGGGSPIYEAIEGVTGWNVSALFHPAAEKTMIHG
jgi:hypothetical protein